MIKWHGDNDDEAINDNDNHKIIDKYTVILFNHIVNWLFGPILIIV